MSLSKHKSHNCATVQMVCWLSSVSSKLSRRFKSHLPPLQTDARKVYLHVFELYRLFLKDTKIKILRLKLGQNNTEVSSDSVRHCSSVCITANSAFYLSKQPCMLQMLMHHSTTKIQCCQHLLTRNPKIYKENPDKCIGLMGIDS